MAFELQFTTTNYLVCKTMLKRYLFEQAYIKYRGNMRAIQHKLGVSMRQSYKMRKLYSNDELKQLLQPKGYRTEGRNKLCLK